MAIQRYETHHRAGENITFHRHDAGYVSLILTGGYDEISADGYWRCSAGDLIIHPPFHLHRNRISKNGARVLNFCYENNVMEFASLHTYGVCRPDSSVVLVHGRVNIDRLTNIVEKADVVAPEDAGDWIDKVAEAIKKNPVARISMLATRFGISPEHLSRVFQTRFGMSPVAYRSEIRFRRIFVAIARTRQSFAMIAQNGGFSDQAHMTRTMLQKTGMTPTQIRASY